MEEENKTEAQPEMTEEQKKEQEEQQKKMEEARNKQMEEHKKRMEEQKNKQKEQLEMTLKQLKVNEDIVNKTILRMKAEVEGITKVDMEAESNETKKAVLKAKAEEMEAMIKGEELKLEMIEMNDRNVKEQIENLDNQPMMPPGMMGRPM